MKWTNSELNFIERNRELINKGNLSAIYNQILASDLNNGEREKILFSLIYLIQGVDSFVIERSSVIRCSEQRLLNLWSLKIKFLGSDYTISGASTLNKTDEPIGEEEPREGIKNLIEQRGYSLEMAENISRGARVLW